MVELIMNALGWIGAFGLLFAFYLNSGNKIETTSIVYLLLNLTAALLLAVNALYTKVYPFLVINIFWTGVALMQIIKRHKANS